MGLDGLFTKWPPHPAGLSICLKFFDALPALGSLGPRSTVVSGKAARRQNTTPGRATLDS